MSRRRRVRWLLAWFGAAIFAPSVEAWRPLSQERLDAMIEDCATRDRKAA